MLLGEIMVNVHVFDNVIPEHDRNSIWSYIENQIWHVYWKHFTFPEQCYNFIPAVDQRWRTLDPARMYPTMLMPRTVFGSDESSLQERHPEIYSLWNKINFFLGNEYIIEGCPEDVAAERNSDDAMWEPPPTKNPNIEQGWRVYANAQPTETVKRSHGVHRDTVDLNDDTSYTLLYCANLEWYPSWYAETVFYPDDTEQTTGDHQQFQGIMPYTQKRDFNIGWAEDGKIVSPKPGRIILYDGRTLHTTRPAAVWSKCARKVIAFRIRKKYEFH